MFCLRAAHRCGARNHERHRCGLSSSGLPPLRQHAGDRVPHLGRRPVRVDARHAEGAVVVCKQRHRLLVVRAQPALERVLRVVLALLERLARLVIFHAAVHRLRLGRRELDVVRAARRLVDPPATDALGEHLVRHLQRDDERDAFARLGEELVEQLGLLHRAREAVQDEAVAAVGLRDALRHHPDNELVSDQPARIHHSLGLHADRRTRLDGGAQHVARGELRNAERLHEFGRL
mmetsp:Transcript_36441/g.91076  ORF Transcript_36441/g.91076 Transcript_36441/m.91076 type:complete len:234 (+) Transcript_36441:337-1038(+)